MLFRTVCLLLAFFPKTLEEHVRGSSIAVKDGEFPVVLAPRQTAKRDPLS